jgi:hypothetical protein
MPAPTSLKLACSPANDKVKYGSSYTCAATITADSFLPAMGTLSYTIDTPASSITLKNGSAQITVTNPGIGAHTIMASFATLGNFGLSGLMTQSFTVQNM